MVKLSAKALDDVVRCCLFKEGEPLLPRVMSRGVAIAMGFHPGRLEKKAARIKQLLDQLPETFHEGTGGGWSFLNACKTKDDELWTGAQTKVDVLMVVGQACGWVDVSPREMWSVLPEGLPYFCVRRERKPMEIMEEEPEQPEE